MDRIMSDISGGENFGGLLKGQHQYDLVGVLREFGIVGVITYVGGAIMLFMFPVQSDFGKQVLYAISGLFLLFLATLISYSRIRAQSMREKSMIEMTQNACNRLAEQLGKNLTDRQVDGISQKIRQLQRDLLTAIFSYSTKNETNT